MTAAADGVRHAVAAALGHVLAVRLGTVTSHDHTDLFLAALEARGYRVVPAREERR